MRERSGSAATAGRKVVGAEESALSGRFCALSAMSISHRHRANTARADPIVRGGPVGSSCRHFSCLLLRLRLASRSRTFPDDIASKENIAGSRRAGHDDRPARLIRGFSALLATSTIERTNMRRHRFIRQRGHEYSNVIEIEESANA